MTTPEKTQKTKADEVLDSQTEYTQSFLEFYKAYGINKTKRTAFNKWKRLNQSQRSLIMDLIPLYHEAFELKYRKYPNNFLSNNAWEDYLYLLEKKSDSNKKAEKIAKAQQDRLNAYDF